MISLLYCGNATVFDGLLISLLSVAAHASRPLDVHLLTMDLPQVNPAFVSISQAQASFLDRVLKEKNPGNRVTRHCLSEEFYAEMKDSPNLESFYTPYTLLRLFSDRLDLPDRVLYLDTDTAAAGDVAPLFDAPVGSADFAGVRDYLGKIFISPRYINAGVLLLNLKQIRADGFFDRARRFCAEKKTAFPDQDAINRLAKHKCFLPRRYNEQRRMRNDTVIRHFSKSIRWLPFFHTVNVKPWQIQELHEKYKTFEFDDVLAEYLRRKEEFSAVESGKGACV